MDELDLARARNGDTAAFERLMTPLEGMVWRVCCGYTRHQEDARDCAQEAMVKAWRNLNGFRGDCSLESWLYRICVSCCLDFLRKRKRQATDSMDTLAESGFDPADPAPQPEETLMNQEQRTDLLTAIDALPEAMRTPLIMSAVEGRRYEDIARATGTAVGTVKSRINRARARLLEILRPGGEQSEFRRVQQDERRAET